MGRLFITRETGVDYSLFSVYCVYNSFAQEPFFKSMVTHGWQRSSHEAKQCRFGIRRDTTYLVALLAAQ